MMKFNENYNSVLIRYCWYENVFFCFCLFCCCFVVLVCFQHLLFQFTIYDFDSFWFMCLSPVKYLSRLSFSMNNLGADLSSSFSLHRPRAAIDNLSFHSPAVAVTVSPIPCRISPSQLAHAPSRSPYRFLFVRLIKSNEIFLHTRREEKKKAESWLTKMKSKRKKAGNNNV